MYYLTGQPGWMRYGWGAPPSGQYAADPPATINPEAEKQALRSQAELLQLELDAVKARLDSLASAESGVEGEPSPSA